jgi:hypothetical protein
VVEASDRVLDRRVGILFPQFGVCVLVVGRLLAGLQERALVTRLDDVLRAALT